MNEVNPVEENVQDHILSNKMYDATKQIAQVLLPGIGALYFAIAQIWGLPAAEEVVGTITAVDVFLGLVLNASTKSYNDSEAKYDGVINVVQDETGTKQVADMQLTKLENPNDIVDKTELTFKVNPVD